MPNFFNSISISKIDDPRMRIVIAMIDLGNPARQNEIVSRTYLAAQHVDYHLKGLVDRGVVVPIIDDETGIRYYALQPVFYDPTFLEGMAHALLPLARSIEGSIEVCEGVVAMDAARETIRYMVNVFLCTIT